MHSGLPLRAGVTLLLLLCCAASSAFGQTGQPFLYIADRTQGLVAFPISSGGALGTQITRTTSGSGAPNDVSAGVSNPKFVSLAENGAVDVFQVDSNGPTSAPPSGQLTGNLSGIAMDPGGNYVYVSNPTPTPKRIEIYTVNQTTGALAPLTTVSVGNWLPRGMAIDSGHLYLAVPNDGSGANGFVAVYPIVGGGLLGSPITYVTGTGGLGPSRVALNPAGTQLFAANQFSGSVSVFSNSSGSLSLVNAAPFTVGSGATAPAGLAITQVNSSDPGSYLIVTDGANTTNNVFVYRIQYGPPPAYPVQVANVSTGGMPLGVTVDPSGSYVFVSNPASSTISRFSISANPSGGTGAMTLLGTATIPGGSPQYLISRLAPPPVSTGTVPTLSTWALVLLGTLLAGSSVVMYRRAYR